MSWRVFLGCLVLLVGSLASADNQPRYEIVDLGEGAATGINNNGLVVASAGKGVTGISGFIWDVTRGRRDIARYSDRETNLSQLPFAINDQGTILFIISEKGPPPFMWTATWNETKGFFGLFEDHSEKMVFTRINNRGALVGGPHIGEQTFLRCATGTIDWSSKYSDLWSIRDLNDMGEWIGFSTDFTPMTNSPRLKGMIEKHTGTDTQYSRLNNNGDLLYRCSDLKYPKKQRVGILTNQGEAIELESPMGLDLQPIAFNCSRITVGWATPLNFSDRLKVREIGIERDWFWTLVSNFDRDYDSFAAAWIDGELQDLNQCIPKDAGWENLDSLADINEHGQIVGRGTKDGKDHAFLLNPVED